MRTRFPGYHRGLSLVEVMIAAGIVGLSAIPVLELVRSGTARLEISEIEVAARQVGADLLERVAAPSFGKNKGLSSQFKLTRAQPVAWSQVISEDASLKKEFDRDGNIRKLLDKHDTRVQLFREAGPGSARELEAYRVVVSWVGVNDELKKVTFARLVEHQ